MKTSRLVISVAVYDFLILKRKNEEKSFFFLVADRRNPDSVETNLHHHVLQIICSSFTGERQCREKTQGVKAHRSARVVQLPPARRIEPHQWTPALFGAVAAETDRRRLLGRSTRHPLAWKLGVGNSMGIC
jgi:hypothetical protein